MDYIELKCSITVNNDEARNILIAELGELGYESFQDSDEGVNAYIPEDQFIEGNYKEIYCVTEKIFGEITFTYSLFKDKNWNEYWEKNFQPVTVNDKILIKAPFHDVKDIYEYEIVLEPKMSFGTGHHATTWLMLSVMYDIYFNKKSVLDIGCGTGILSIFADLKNAGQVVGFDNNDWAYNNALENIALNNCRNVKILLGEISGLKIESDFDIILANINRNVILEEMDKYLSRLKKGGSILFSGILTENYNEINNSAIRNNLQLKMIKDKDNWLVLHYILK